MILVCDIDGTLTGNKNYIREYNKFIKKHKNKIFLIYATGRNYKGFIDVLTTENLYKPDIAILNVGATIYVKNGRYKRYERWEKYINFNWDKEIIKKVLKNFKEIKLQEQIQKYKVSYYILNNKIDIKKIILKIKNELKKKKVDAKIIVSQNYFLDILPERAGKAEATKFILKEKNKKGKIIVAGDSGNDIELFKKYKNGIIVKNAENNLKNFFKNKKTIYFSKYKYAKGVLEGIKFFMR